MNKLLTFLLMLFSFSVNAIELPEVSECKKSEDEYWTPFLCALEKYNLFELEKSCGTDKEYKNLFELSGSVGGGASSMEIYAEVNEKAIYSCPEKYFDALLVSDENLQKEVLNYVPIGPPWEMAEFLFKYKDDKRYSDLLKKHFEFLLTKCVDAKGVAIEGCGL